MSESIIELVDITHELQDINLVTQDIDLVTQDIDLITHRCNIIYLIKNNQSFIISISLLVIILFFMAYLFTESL